MSAMNSDYRTLARACLAYAVLALAALALGGWTAASGVSQGPLALAASVLPPAAVLVYVYVLRGFRILLNRTSDYHDLDLHIRLLVLLNLALLVLGVADAAVAGFKTQTAVVILAATVFEGVVMFLAGLRLRRNGPGLYGMKSWTAKLFLAMGVCLALPLLLPLAVVLAVALALVLARIFTRAGREGAGP